MRLIWLAILGFFTTSTPQVSAQDSAQPVCAKDFYPRGNACVSQRMSDFLVCVESTGGNKQQVYERISSEINTDNKGKASASASGIVIKGGGSVELGANAEKKLYSDLTSNWYGGGMAACLKVLEAVAPTGTPPIDPPPAPPAPPPSPVVATYKVCSGEYERSCRNPHDAYLYCYSNVQEWANQRCTAATVSRIDTYGGNKCGYSLDFVTCVGPK